MKLYNLKFCLISQVNVAFLKHIHLQVMMNMSLNVITENILPITPSM